jgi:hypothetical protein
VTMYSHVAQYGGEDLYQRNALLPHHGIQARETFAFLRQNLHAHW